MFVEYFNSLFCQEVALLGFFWKKTLFSTMYLYLEPNMLGVWGFGKLYLVVWCEVVFCGVVVVGSA